LTEDGVCYITLCEKKFSTQLSYSFLNELKKEFNQLHGKDVQKADKPYAFLSFDKFIQQTIKLYSDSRNSNLQKITEDLKDVQDIMKKNIQEIFDRGNKLNDLHEKGSSILDGSKSLKNASMNANRWHYWRTYGPIFIVLMVVILVIFFRYYFW
jgi:vesicle transport protein SEC22